MRLKLRLCQLPRVTGLRGGDRLVSVCLPSLRAGRAGLLRQVRLWRRMWHGLVIGVTVVSPVFIGRREEMTALAGALRRVREGDLAVALVGGEVGVGKTRLAGELAGIPPEAAAPADELARFGLTDRERDVLALLAAGKSNPEIARVLFISAKTASVHVSNIMAKPGVRRRGEAAALAHRLGVTGRACT